MSGPAGDSSTVSIQFLVDPAAAIAGLAAVGDSLDTVTASSVGTTAGLADLGAAFDATAASMTTVVGADLDVSASLDDITASAATGSAGLADLGAAADSTSASMVGMAAATDSASTSTAAGADSMGMFSGGMMGALEPMAQMIATLGIMAAAFQALSIIQNVTSYIEGLIQQMFSLDEQTQKTVNSWQYLFGSVAKGQQLAGWAFQESPNLPFTAVDLRGAISTLGTAGYSSSTIEQFIPFLADIASTFGASAYGGQGVTLSQAANAIRMASFGLSRMLRTDLGVSPEALIPYGLEGKKTATGIHITNEATLIPALERWAIAHHLAGAAGEQETRTFWGAYSSFQDYMQNIGQTIGGLNPQTGEVTPGSFFGTLQEALVGINGILSGAMTAPAAPRHLTAAEQTRANRLRRNLAGTAYEDTQTPFSLGGLMDTLEQIMGGGSTSISDLFKGIFGGITAGGGGTLIQDLFNDLKNFGEWLSSSNTQENIKKLGEAFGDLVGKGMKEAAAELPQIGNDFQQLGNAANQLWNSFTPEQQKSIKDFFGALIQSALPAAILEVGQAISTVAGDIRAIAEAISAFNQFEQQLQQWANDLGVKFSHWGSDMIQKFIEGILGETPQVKAAAQGVAAILKQVLGFSLPEEGPLATADRWMPDMIQLMVSSMTKELPALESAANKAAETIAQAFTGRGANSQIATALTTVNGQTPYQQGQTFVDQFTHGAVSRIATTGSPLAQAFKQLMTEVADQVVADAVNTLNRAAYNTAAVPGGNRVFGSLGTQFGGF